MIKEKFLFQVSFEQLEKIEKRLKKKKVPYLLSVWTGVFKINGDNPKYLIYYGNCEVKDCEWWIHCSHTGTMKHFFGTMDYYKFADDECFGCLNIDEENIKVPNVKDIFSFKEL